MLDKRKLYIHIGTVKTGTTALQRFLNSNRTVLQKKGITYPQNKTDHFAHHRLSWALRTTTGHPVSSPYLDLGTPEQEWEYLADQLHDFQNVISSEHFIRHSYEKILEFKSLTDNYRPKIIVYWRRRDNLEDSWYNQLVKTV
jgi:hypothetical protein